MTKPKILFLSDVEYFKGGAERSIFDAMATPTITPTLCTPKPGPMSEFAEKEKNIATQTLDFGSVLTVHRPFKIRDIFRTFWDAFRAAKQLKSITREYAAVHTNGLKAHGVACFARLIGGKPVIVHYRSIPFTKPEKAFWKATQIIAHRLVLVSRPCWPGKTMPDNVEVIFNGLNLPDRKILPKRPKSRRPFTLGFIGRIHDSKGVHDLIEWFAYAHKEKSLDIRLSLRGEGAPEDPDYEPMIRQMVKDKGLTELCTFEGFQEGFENIYGDIDVNIVSSVTPDPLPRSCMEASALGIPVIGYPAGGIPYMMKDGENGFLIKDKEEFYKTLKRLMEEDGLYEKISTAAIQNAKENFTMTALHESLAKVYATLP